MLRAEAKLTRDGDKIRDLGDTIAVNDVLGHADGIGVIQTDLAQHMQAF